MPNIPTPAIILASSSAYRRELLNRLRLRFDCHSPDIDEQAQPGETATELALRLATDKAVAIQALHPDAIIIGSDQVAESQGILLGKPGTRDNAVQQLMLCTGRTASFHTGLCVLYKDQLFNAVVPYHVHFRDFDHASAQRYIEIEQPLDCAGSFKCEGLGISLFKRQYGDDPTSLIGLPLIKTCEFLRQLGVQLP